MGKTDFPWRGITAATNQGDGTTTRLCGGTLLRLVRENKEVFSVNFAYFLNFCQISIKYIVYLGYFLYLCAK